MVSKPEILNETKRTAVANGGKPLGVAKLLKYFAAAIFFVSLVGVSAQAAGVRELEIPTDAKGPAIKAMVWTPCAVPPKDVAIKHPVITFVIPGVRDCPVEGSKLPLVAISHGLGGWYLGHHDTAEALADGGFVVVAFNHVLDSGFDMKRANSMESMVERPADVKRVIDYMLRSSPVRANIDPQRIGFFGFSRGGYTGLVLAGGVTKFPLWMQAVRIWESWWHHVDLPAQVPGPDPRIKAFVIADPLSFFPDKASLQNVKAPMQLWGSESGGQGVEPKDVAAVADNLPARPEFHVVPKSTHLSFLAPCPANVAKLDKDACGDPPGFDRIVFHQQFDAQVLAFFRRNLNP